MPAPVVVGHTFGDTSIAEDVSDIIYQITPDDTPFWNLTGETESTGVFHEWQIRSLTTRQHNAAPEGFSYTFTTGQRLPSRVANMNQVVTKDVRVSRTTQRITHHAIDDQFADQLQQAMIEWKTDAEHTLLQGTLASGNVSIARQMSGFLEAASHASSFTALAAVTLSETMFNDFIQFAWEQGGAPQDVLMGGRLKRGVSAFTASTNQTRFIDAGEQRLINTISFYESDFFMVRTHLTRDLPTLASTGTGGHMIFVDKTMVRKAFIDRPFTKRVPETADGLDGVIIGELTLEVGNSNAHFIATEIYPNP
jgi:hypothetical protein